MPLALIVDDAAFIRLRTRKLLEENGYEVEEAKDGEEAIQKYKEVSPDVVLLDITMPVMDGITALKGIKSIDPQAKVVMCTAVGQQSLVLEAIKAGANDYLLKPLDPEKVLASVKKLVGK
ncbi:MAG: response regulator [Firmicutes bacterium]|jgi:two-component system chemotaxis response regulator CheY|nr:response regulator [Bacillota bacterium]